MNSGDLLYGIDARLITLMLSCVSFGVIELGFRLGRRAGRNAGDAEKSQAAQLLAAMLALLGLLMAFTFSAAAARFDARKAVVLEEANAIGTAHLRTYLLPDPERAEMQDLLRRYVDARLEFYQSGTDEETQHAVREKEGQLQQELWSRAAAVGRRSPEAVTVGLLLASLNAVIDVQAKQEVAFDNHVPESILFALFFATVLVLGAVGFHNGLCSRRHVLLTSILLVMLAVTVLLILDLDRPRRGLIQINQRSMILVKESLDRAHR